MKRSSAPAVPLSNSKLIYTGAHYLLCPVELREIWSKVYANEDLRSEFMELLGVSRGQAEAVIISTCNRFDLVIYGTLGFKDIIEIFGVMIKKVEDTEGKKTSFSNLDQATLETYLRFYEGQEAAAMLFAVSSSLDSLVLGEPHILGQIKTAFAQSLSQGCCGPQLDIFFSKAFSVAKRVRNETNLAKNGVSIGHAAVEVARKIFDDFSKLNVLVVGAGEMAKVVAKHFVACGASSVNLTNRSLQNAQLLAKELAPFPTRVLKLEDALKDLFDFNIIIVATSSQQFLITCEDFKSASKSLKKRSLIAELKRMSRGQPQVIVDISVPRNVDPEVGKLDDMFLFDVDDLDKVMTENRASRKEAAVAAQVIIDSEIISFFDGQKIRESLNQIGKFHAFIHEIVLHSLEQESTKNPKFTKDRATILAKSIAKKIISSPAAMARRNLHQGNTDAVSLSLDELFFKKTKET